MDASRKTKKLQTDEKQKKSRRWHQKLWFCIGSIILSTYTDVHSLLDTALLDAAIECNIQAILSELNHQNATRMPSIFLYIAVLLIPLILPADSILAPLLELLDRQNETIWQTLRKTPLEMLIVSAFGKTWTSKQFQQICCLQSLQSHVYLWLDWQDAKIRWSEFSFGSGKVFQIFRWHMFSRCSVSTAHHDRSVSSSRPDPVRILLGIYQVQITSNHRKSLLIEKKRSQIQLDFKEMFKLNCSMLLIGQQAPCLHFKCEPLSALESASNPN